MGTKNDPAKFDRYTNALPDEPMFILLARDPNAPELVRLWACRRQELITLGSKPASDRAMIDEAYECAEAMENWRLAHLGEWRKP